MKRLAVLCVAGLLLTACGNGDGDVAATGTPAMKTPDVDRAGEGMVNRPKQGDYDYTYSSERTEPSKPGSTPARSKPTAALRSKVTYEADITVIRERTTEGPAIQTLKRRFENERVVDVSFETAAPTTTRSCTYAEPVVILEIPVEEGEIDPQSLEGEGNACGGERKATVKNEEEIKDALGSRWTVWPIEVVTETELQTVTETRWFSPDLGKEVKVEITAELKDRDGTVTTRATQSYLLESYPT